MPLAAAIAQLIYQTVQNRSPRPHLEGAALEFKCTNSRLRAGITSSYPPVIVQVWKPSGGGTYPSRCQAGSRPGPVKSPATDARRLSGETSSHYKYGLGPADRLLRAGTLYPAVGATAGQGVREEGGSASRSPSPPTAVSRPASPARQLLRAHCSRGGAVVSPCPRAHVPRSEEHAGRALQEAAQGLEELRAHGAVDGAVVARQRGADVGRHAEGPVLGRGGARKSVTAPNQ
jgi:hypothetical protein